MVVTDLHGDWDAYQRYRDCFITRAKAGQADVLVFVGDLIHGEGQTYTDRSVDILIDLLELRKQYPIVYLCGNHELPHIYGFPLGKGDIEYTPAFEKALSQSEYLNPILELLDELPFFLRTTAGVTITHAGATAIDTEEAQVLFTWQHQELLDWANQQIARGEVEQLRMGYARLSEADSYTELAEHYLGVSEPDNPRYDNLLRGFLTTAHYHFALLRPTFFTGCEREHHIEHYGQVIEMFLEHFAEDYTPQHFLVAGHMSVAGGHEVVAKQHLRLASATHATPREAGQYLLFDVAQPITTMEELCAGLKSVF